VSNVNSPTIYGDISGNGAIYYVWTRVIEIYSSALVIGRIANNSTIGYGRRTGIADVDSTALAIVTVTGGNVINDNTMGYGWRAVADVNSTALIPDAPIGNCKA
jgi:hypothetical protein